MNTKQQKVQPATISQLPPKKFTQEKLQSIVEAASALTSLVQEETGSSSLPSPTREDNNTKTPKEESPAGNADSDESKDEEEDEPSKRFIPEHKKPDAALTFPEKVSYFDSFGVSSITFISTGGYADLVFCYDKTLTLSLLFCLSAHEYDGVCRR
jgi:hypothetical protein